MARKRRADAPQTTHHIWARGIDRRSIFDDDRERRDLIERLSEVIPEGGAACLAWALMTNHLHLVLRRGGTPLATLMRRIHTGFAVRFNLSRERTGHVFEGRFGSRLVEDEGDLLGVISYVHRNPLAAGLVRDLDGLSRYPWCGYGALVGRRQPLPFESVAEVGALFGGPGEVARARIDDWMWRSLEASRDDGAALEQALEALIQRACRELGASRRDLLGARRSQAASLARARICHGALAEIGLRPTQVAKVLGISASAVCQAARRALASPVGRSSIPPAGRVTSRRGLTPS